MAEALTTSTGLPTTIELDPAAGMPPYSPRELSLIEEYTGKDFDKISSGGDRMRVMVWLHLRRLGFDPSWEDAAEVLIEHPTPNPSDPAI